MQSQKVYKPKANLLAIDSGYRYFAYSVFEGSDLISADLAKSEKAEDWNVWTNQPPSFLSLVPVIQKYEWVDPVAVIEYPRVRRDTQNPEAIVKLAAACGAYTSLLQASGFKVEWVDPASWKGTVPKKVMCKRIIAKVKPDEYNRISKPKDHNVIDAIGIGFWKVRRK